MTMCFQVDYEHNDTQMGFDRCIMQLLETRGPLREGKWVLSVAGDIR